MISRTTIEEAARRIGGYIRKTPVMYLEDHFWDLEGNIVLKLEQFQHSGSFKARGAFNRLLSQHIPQAGVIAASGGNHGAAVAYAARQLGYRAEIFVPEISSLIKVDRLRSYGAHVTIIGADYAEALAVSQTRAAETGALVVHAYDQLEVVAGQGTLGHEMAKQIPDLDTVLIAVGGGGLIGGVASWFQHGVRVIGVEPEGAPTLYAALQAGKPTDVEVSGVVADSLGAQRIGSLAFDIATHFVEKVVLVNDEAILAAQKRVWEDLRMVVELGGAAAIAALLAGHYRPKAGERVGVLMCGANTDLEKIACLNR